MEHGAAQNARDGSDSRELGRCFTRVAKLISKAMPDQIIRRRGFRRAEPRRESAWPATVLDLALYMADRTVFGIEDLERQPAFTGSACMCERNAQPAMRIGRADLACVLCRGQQAPGRTRTYWRTQESGNAPSEPARRTFSSFIVDLHPENGAGRNLAEYFFDYREAGRGTSDCRRGSARRPVGVRR